MAQTRTQARGRTEAGEGVMELGLKVGKVEAWVIDPEQRYSPDVSLDWANLLCKLVTEQRGVEEILKRADQAG